MMRPALFGVCLAVVAACGCEPYRPVPLDAASVEKALTPPAADILRIRAENLNHPILRPIALDLGDGLSPDEAAVLAVVNSPDLRAARDERAIADAQVIEAGLLPNPQFSATYDVVTFGETLGELNPWSLGPSWEVTSLISRAAKVEAAATHRKAVDLDIAWKEWQAAEAAKTAVYRLFSLDAQAALAAENDRRLAENLELVRKALAEGHVTNVELAAAQSAFDQAHSKLLGLQEQVHLERLRLNRLVGMPADTPVALQRGFDLPSQLAPPEAARLLRDLEKRRLDLVALRRGYDSQEASLRAAILEQFPKISIAIAVGSDNSKVGTVGPGVTVDLPIFNRNQGRIAAEKATRKQLFDEYVSRVFEARADIASLLATVRTLNTEIQAAQKAEAALDQLVTTYRAALQAGQADVVTYYTVWGSLVEKRAEILGLRQELAETRIALEVAAGLYSLEAADQAPPAGQPPGDEEKR